MREIEIKLRVRDLESLEEKLKACGCVLSEPVYQRDIIYALRGSRNEFESAKEGDVIIRLRYNGDKAELNLKRQCSSESDNLEYESEISAPDEVRQMLLALDWHPAIEVKKMRREGKLGAYGICIDEVEELGTFMELEKLMPDDASPDKVREELFKALEEFGFSRSDEETKGYDTQIYYLHRERK